MNNAFENILIYVMLAMLLVLIVGMYEINNQFGERINHLESVTLGGSRCIK